MKKRQRKKKSSNRNLRVLGNLEYFGEEDIPTTVELIQYNASECSKKSLAPNDDLRKYLKQDAVSWFKVTGISDTESINQICKNFGLHGFDVRELLSDAKIVKYVLYEDVSFILTSGYYIKEDNETEDMQIAFIMGKNFIISFKESPIPVFKDVEKAIFENNITLRQKSADFLLYILLNTVNNFNNDFIIHAEDSLWEIEDQLILRQEDNDILHQLRNQRKAHLQLKRFILSQREEYENLLENTNGMIREENILYFENLDDKYRTTSNYVENYEETVKSLLDLYYNNNAMRMNEIMKRLTLVATIFIPLTFLVGVWGMNFTNMPEINWEYGYGVAWLVFIITALVIIWLMKKKRWF